MEDTMNEENDLEKRRIISDNQAENIPTAPVDAQTSHENQLKVDDKTLNDKTNEKVVKSTTQNFLASKGNTKVAAVVGKPSNKLKASPSKKMDIDECQPGLLPMELSEKNSHETSNVTVSSTKKTTSLESKLSKIVGKGMGSGGGGSGSSSDTSSSASPLRTKLFRSLSKDLKLSPKTKKNSSISSITTENLLSVLEDANDEEEPALDQTPTTMPNHQHLVTKEAVLGSGNQSQSPLQSQPKQVVPISSSSSSTKITSQSPLQLVQKRGAVVTSSTVSTNQSQLMPEKVAVVSCSSQPSTQLVPKKVAIVSSIGNISSPPPPQLEQKKVVVASNTDSTSQQLQQSVQNNVAAVSSGSSNSTSQAPPAQAKQNKVAAVPSSSTDSTTQPPKQPTGRKTTKKYVYRLRSKSGMVLKYSSPVPIVLKKPLINLTKIKVADVSDDDNDSKTKKYYPRVIRGAPASATKDGVRSKSSDSKPAGVAGKRGRPHLSKKPPPRIIKLEDQHDSDATSDSRENSKNDSTSETASSSFGMQTRKRKLKFLPDGRLVGPSKKYKGSAAAMEKEADDLDSDGEAPFSDDDPAVDNPSSDEDWQASDEDLKKFVTAASKRVTSLSETNRLVTTPSETKKVASAEMKKFAAVPSESKIGNSGERKRKLPSMFDSETVVRRSKSSSLSTSTTSSRVADVENSDDAASGKNDASVASNTSTPLSTIRSARKGAVDPAQLLSSLIGITILPSQLNVVRFKPKLINSRRSFTQKKITLAAPADARSLQKSGTRPDPFKTEPTPYELTVSKSSMQKIPPKPSPSSSEKNSNLSWKTPTATPSPAVAAAASSPSPPSKMKKKSYIPFTPQIPTVVGCLLDPVDEVPNFDNFTDSKTVKTRGGPKKFSLQKQQQQQQQQQQQEEKNMLDESDAECEFKTVYDLIQNLFDQIPSWNLHVMPDTNTFCIAQVSRGRMGIPILKKSIELNPEFAAKIYVHQLHCKKFDGVYDTESKILSLIREIDGLAA